MSALKLREALEIIQRPREGRRERFILACSTYSTNLKTLLEAYLLKRRTGSDVQVETTSYGDLLSGLERFSPMGYAGGAIVCEWFDLDQRLGFRRLGGWAPSSFENILHGVETASYRLRRTIEAITTSIPVAIALPTLPLPPIAICDPARTSELEISLWAALLTFAQWCASNPRVYLLNREELDRLSPPMDRFDFKAELSYGTPYKLAHASAISYLLSRLLAPNAPLKGLITDLDDTLWDGILGEVGVDGVGFSLEHNAQEHGLYQQLLQSFAERGVLVAIASKNDQALVEKALSRTDLLLERDNVFPVVSGWSRKSESVARILQSWNISAESVAFIDDSPLELAEVQLRFPQIRCLLFPKQTPARFIDFVHTLREYFGRPAVRDEDRLRLRSLRQDPVREQCLQDSSTEESFLESLGAVLSFQITTNTDDDRAFELINKTNQFNLNGHRYSQSEWIAYLSRPGSFLLTASYADKFGQLGKIAVVVGWKEGLTAHVVSWVMSCRAFSRRIEHATLRYLFDRLNVGRISFTFHTTERNGPMRNLFSEFQISEIDAQINKTDFEALCPRISHRVEEFAT